MKNIGYADTKNKLGGGPGDSALTYTPLYSKCKGKDCGESKVLKKKKRTEPSPPKMDKVKWGDRKVEQKRQKIKTS